MIYLIKLLTVMLKIIHVENVWILKSIVNRKGWDRIDREFCNTFDEYFDKIISYGEDDD